MVTTLAREKKDATNFGQRLRQLREAAGLTQQQLADLVEMEPQNLSRLERGLRSPNWKTVLSLAAALGVEPNDFLGDDPPARKRKKGK